MQKCRTLFRNDGYERKKLDNGFLYQNEEGRIFQFNTENKTVLVYKDDEPVELELRDIGIIYQQMKELR